MTTLNVDPAPRTWTHLPKVHTGAHYKPAYRIDAAVKAGQSVPCRQPDAYGWLSDDPDLHAAAAKACKDCPVIKLCRAAAADSRERFGVWGGRDRTPTKRAAHASICTEEGCGQPHYSRGFCRHHYGLLWRKGGVEAVKAAMTA